MTPLSAETYSRKQNHEANDKTHGDASSRISSVSQYNRRLLARKEERQMIEKFSDAYRQYQRSVPMFWPCSGRVAKTFQCWIAFGKPTTSAREKVIFMNRNSFSWIVIIAFLICCCGPMLLIGRHRKRGQAGVKKDDKSKSDDRV